MKRLLPFLLLVPILLDTQATAGVSAGSDALSQAAYDRQMGILVRGWSEITGGERLVICADYFGDTEGTFAYLLYRMDGDLMRRTFDDFFAEACVLEPLELTG